MIATNLSAGSENDELFSAQSAATKLPKPSLPSAHQTALNGRLFLSSCQPYKAFDVSHLPKRCYKNYSKEHLFLTQINLLLEMTF
jgi:hypothetical protein